MVGTIAALLRSEDTLKHLAGFRELVLVPKQRSEIVQHVRPIGSGGLIHVEAAFGHPLRLRKIA